MPKKKGKGKGGRGDAPITAPSTPTPAGDDPVCDCIELVLGPPPTRRNSGGDVTEEIDVDDQCAVLHRSDAHKLDIRDGEPALIVRAIPRSSELQSGNDDGLVGVICKVRVPDVAAPSSRASKKSAAPLISKGKGGHDAAASGHAILSRGLYAFASRGADDDGQARTAPASASSGVPTPQPASATKGAPYTSPSKSNFSFSKGGGGDSIISPSPSNTSPSGSKFSFAKGGEGGSVLSPTPTKTTPTQHTKRTQIKVVAVPLINLSPEQLRRLCPDAQKLVLSPLSSSIESCLSSSTKIVETLVKSKYRDAYVQAQSTATGLDWDHTTTNSALKSAPETISISLRGMKEIFRIVRVEPAPGGHTIQQSDSELAASFGQLDISGSEQKESVTKLLHSEKEIAYRVTSRTTIELASSPDKAQSTSPSAVPTTKQEVLCAGLDSTFSRVKDTLLPPLLHPDLFPSDGPLRPPKGALLFGPAGVGKSLLAAQIAHDLNNQNQEKVHVRLVQCTDILSSTAIVGEGEKVLTDIFAEAERKATDCAGSLVILDDVHLICPRRGGVGSGGLGVDQLAGTLLALLDGIGSSDASGSTSNKSSGGLVALAITTDPGLLDPALRRPGRLDVEVEVAVPDDEARADILSFHLSMLGAEQHINESDIQTLARLAKGFTGADCKLAVKEAVRTAISRSGQPGSLQSNAVEYADLEHAIRITKPSAIKSVAVEVPKVPWSAIGGMDHVKALLKESIELPLTHPHLFEMMQVPPPKGILLYGPPGCSKTLMARAIATEGQMNFLAVKGPELLSKWLGESERALASLFRRARLASPAVIFFDEVDAIASKRGDSGGSGGDRLLSQLLTELDGVTSGGSGPLDGKGGRVVVVGATNRPDVLDAALTRPGRMDRMIYVGLPDEQGRKSIFEIGLSGKDCHEDVDVEALASDEVSKDYSGAEIVALCKDAALHAIGEMDDGGIDRPQIHMRHLLRSIDDMKPRTTNEMLHFYDSFRGRH